MRQTVLMAYLDSGSGGMLVQVAVLGLAGLVVFLKFYGRALLNFLRRLRLKKRG